MKVLFIGDISARAGRNAVARYTYEIREKESVDFCIANCENAAGGFGVTREILDELLRSGVDAFTTGNHVFSKKDVIPLLCEHEYDIIRPQNLPQSDPGSGVMVCTARGGEKVAVVNLMGRLYIDMPLSSPFDAAREAVEQVKDKTKYIIVDLHAEATSEKRAMGYFLDGTVSAVLGTHTHVQTADAIILPKKTAYITDVGMCGAYNSVLGAKTELAVNRFISSVAKRFEPGEGEIQFNAVLMTFAQDGTAEKIERIFITDNGRI